MTHFASPGVALDASGSTITFGREILKVAVCREKNTAVLKTGWPSKK